ncbi:hypothetical protein N7513_003227 [Penicillium frequentans]|uniref:Uncharacterized protein n=1 Tax=Penicillium frequentans TaxID=3151616 RepID=A0AAD6CH85_9EURO|nr:hypothetical protein N7494_013232 [Penicillium glabrum]KAJ5557641.1 hypothetical protein N7513_003227 [Penicillium glabrum]
MYQTPSWSKNEAVEGHHLQRGSKPNDIQLATRASDWPEGKRKNDISVNGDFKRANGIDWIVRFE